MWEVLLTCGAVAVLVVMQVRHTRAVKRSRREIVSAAAGLLSEPDVVQQGIAFPTLTGRYQGVPVKVELVPDDLTPRQLPRLWLVATVRTPVAVDDALDVLLRPQSTDIVSPGYRFPHEHQAPAGWPSYARIATRQPAPPPWRTLRSALPVLHAPGTKDLIVGPGGVRIVEELARGEVGPHRLARRSRFEVRLEPARLKRVLDAALGIAREVSAAVAADGSEPVAAALPHQGSRAG